MAQAISAHKRSQEPLRGRPVLAGMPPKKLPPPLRKTADKLALYAGCYAVAMAVLGAVGAATHSFEKKAMHSLYGGLGCFVLMSVCSAVIRFGVERKVVFAGVMSSLVFELIFLIVFLIQGFRSFRSPDKLGRAALFALNAAVTGVALGLGAAPVVPQLAPVLKRKAQGVMMQMWAKKNMKAKK
uniref:Uncharacterized protein n=1 Tax=Zooxanthella nutricula TaxID=1333877 RepID=A0A7S2QAA4_9DINO